MPRQEAEKVAPITQALSSTNAASSKVAIEPAVAVTRSNPAELVEFEEPII